MGKKKPTPAEAGKGHPTVARYYSVVAKPYENKNKEEPLKTEEEIALSAENNESNDKRNDSTITTTIRPEKATIMGPSTAPVDDRKDLELDKKKDKNKEEVESSGEEDEDGSTNKINSEIKIMTIKNSILTMERMEATNIGADKEVTNVEVPSSEQNNVEGSDEKVAEKSKSIKELAEASKQVTKTINNIHTVTEEATNMGADTEAIGIEAQSGLLNHVVGFYANGVAASNRTEEEVNKVGKSKSLFEKRRRK